MGTTSFSASSAMCAAVVGVAASSFCALSLVAVYTLSPSFLTLIRDLFLGWFSLRSSFTLAAATFFGCSDYCLLVQNLINEFLLFSETLF